MALPPLRVYIEEDAKVVMDENPLKKAGFLTVPVKKGINFMSQVFSPSPSAYGILEKPGIQYSNLWRVYKEVPWVRGIVDGLSKDASKVSFNIQRKNGESGANTQIKDLKAFFEDPSEGEEVFGDIISMIVNDCLVFDGHGLEVVPSRDGTPVELKNVSGITLKPVYSKEKRREIGWIHELEELKLKVFFKTGKTYKDTF